MHPHRAEESSSHIRGEMQKHNFSLLRCSPRSPHPAGLRQAGLQNMVFYWDYDDRIGLQAVFHLAQAWSKRSCTAWRHTPSKGLMPPITACPHWSDVLGGLPWLGVGQLAPPPASNLTVMSTHPCPITPSSPILTSMTRLSPCPCSIPILSPELLAHGHRTSA